MGKRWEGVNGIRDDRGIIFAEQREERILREWLRDVERESRLPISASAFLPNGIESDSATAGFSFCLSDSSGCPCVDVFLHNGADLPRRDDARDVSVLCSLGSDVLLVECKVVAAPDILSELWFRELLWREATEFSAGLFFDGTEGWEGGSEF